MLHLCPHLIEKNSKPTCIRFSSQKNGGSFSSHIIFGWKSLGNLDFCFHAPSGSWRCYKSSSRSSPEASGKGMASPKSPLGFTLPKIHPRKLTFWTQKLVVLVDVSPFPVGGIFWFYEFSGGCTMEIYQWMFFSKPHPMSCPDNGHRTWGNWDEQNGVPRITVV